MKPGLATIDLIQLRKSCGSCALHELCLPAGISGDDLKQLDTAVRDRRVLDAGDALYRDGDAFDALYVVRAGSLKTFVLNEAGDMQILGFHLPGEIVGIDALANDRHISQAEALERSSICELPYAQLQKVTTEVPALQRQLMRVISREVVAEHRHLVMMGKQPAQERLAIFLQSLSDRYSRLHRDGTTLILPMSRNDIANYLGMVVETVSRLFTRLAEMGVLEVDRKSVRVLRPDLLAGLCSDRNDAASPPDSRGRATPGHRQLIRIKSACPTKGVNMSHPRNHRPGAAIAGHHIPHGESSCTPAPPPPSPTTPAALPPEALEGTHWIDSLRDGTRVLIRPIRAEDRAREQDFINRLSPQSRRFRFMGTFSQASPALIHQLVDIDYATQMAFVALLHEDGKLREIGVSRYSATGADGQCECAVTVADDWRQRGLAVLLMQHLIKLARQNGYKQMISIDAADNEAMHDLAHYLGFQRQLDPQDSTQVIHTLSL